MNKIDNIETLKDLYGDHYSEEEIIEVTNVNNSIFYMIGQQNPTVLDAGYIILKDGKFVKIDQSQDHDDVFSYFITLYLELPAFKEFGSGKAAMKLNDLGLPVYFGIKSRYLGELESKGFTENYSQNIEFNALEKKGGTFILSLPVDDSGICLTDKQKKSVQSLLASYEEVFEKTDMPFDLVIGNIKNGIVFSKEEIDKLIFSKKTR